MNKRDAQLLEFVFSALLEGLLCSDGGDNNHKK